MLLTKHTFSNGGQGLNGPVFLGEKKRDFTTKSPHEEQLPESVALLMLFAWSGCPESLPPQLKKPVFAAFP